MSLWRRSSRLIRGIANARSMPSGLCGAMLALTGGSVPFALFYTGLQQTPAATGALVNHFRFVLVALFGVALLEGRIRPAMWAGLCVLLVRTLVGTNLNTLQWNTRAWLIAASTMLFAIDFVIAKHLLRGLATLTLMTAE